MNYRETMSRLNGALHTIDSAYGIIAKKNGLNFNSLMVICLIDESTPVTQKQICDSLHLPKSTVHSILFDFIDQEYIALVAGKNKKEKIVTFTKKGAAHFESILKETQQFEDTILTSLGSDACGFLVETAERLGDIIEEELIKRISVEA